MATLAELRNELIRKLEALKKSGRNAYPSRAEREASISEILTNFSKLSKRKRGLFLSGRVIGKREHGGSIFADVSDGTARIQIYLKRDDAEDDSFSMFVDAVDIGDFVEVTGTLFITKRKEKTLVVSSWKMLAKALRPLPDKWHGLQDAEEKSRKRYLDMLMAEESRTRFLARSRTIKEVRSFLDRDGFIEVETPMLHLIAGSATALPFVTHHNALDIDLYLRIAPELYL